ncbi:hypothetical protein [Brevibacillus porteri]|uniref:Uncharacterized protein n=1 Tax=Brevibacillus porteri TaxID=2126350 RepID=A0ABX5FJS8_9BACL|nr:hypothetical protein [Brevibacillus porteri]MED1800296.1 hypothetical protein [Brevibacillus porteri]MED2130804.1 hypothetical protein [Brevibacillus porteri]MED2744935.1 hypothetical protein [Brevibacillus porteri]MED2813385.1 hypothetical protein [Brevibacillus porteri]MED2894982.1 hypothetical protein [Brevibacillus porteri]
MKYKHLEFWLTWNNNVEKLRLPVIPPKIAVKIGHSYIDIELVAIGESTIIGESTLEEYSFSTFWPESYDPGLCEYDGFPSPEEFVETLKRWKNSGYPIRFTVTENEQDIINVPVTIRDFSYEWDGFDIDFKLALKEYRFVTIESTEVSIPFQTTGKGKRPDTRKAKVSATKKKEEKESLVDKYNSR